MGKGAIYEDYVLTIFYFFLLYSSLVSLITIHYKQKEIFNCFLQIHSVDKKLKKLGVKVNYTLLRRTNKTYMFTACISYLVYSVLDLPSKLEISLIDIVTSFCFGVALMPKITICYYIIVLVSVTGVKFVNINQIAFKLTRNRRPNRRNVVLILREIQRLHFKLCDIARMINASFSLSLFAVVSSIFLLINTATIFDIPTYKDRAVAMMFWTVFDSVCLFGILISCEITKYQVS